MSFTFTGGLDLQSRRRRPLPAIRVFSNPTHIVLDFPDGKKAAFDALVAPGDRVSVYDRVGTLTAGEDVIPVFSGISGVVRELVTDGADTVTGVVIDGDGEEKRGETAGYTGPLTEFTPEMIVDIMKEAGIRCRGSYGFIYKRIEAAGDGTVKLILNCCESEPGVTSRKKLLDEDLEAVLNGAKIVMKAVDVRKCDAAIEQDSALRSVLASRVRKDPLFDVRKMKRRYPQDEETSMIYALGGPRLSDVSRPELSKYVMIDAETAASVYRAAAFGVPYCSRVVTVGNENVLCPIGTPVSELLEFCGVETSHHDKIIAGGPMRGRACALTGSYVGPDTDAVTVLTEKDGRPIPEMTECTHCGRCVSVCPSRIMPYYIAQLSRKKKYSACLDYGAAACTECGCCDYVCPSYIPIKKLIRIAKSRSSAAPEKEHNENTETV
ncbi:MAG: hypothetical protein J5879_04090 [Clostridia bacterium]|nr:hypothetical protein [Clostridia bacterium]